MFVNNNSFLFTKLGDCHSYNTRHGKSLIELQIHKTSSYESSPYYKCSKIFNAIPKEIRDVDNPVQFKRLLKNFLIDKAYYDIASFTK